MAKATQENRLLAINTPLGEDYLLINKLKVSEGISELFEIDIELLYDEELDDAKEVTPIDVSKILGQTVNVRINQRNDSSRLFIGMVSQFTQVGRRQRFSYYTARIVPSVWRLTQNVQCRIFQRKSVPDIMAEILEDYQVKFQLKKTYKPRNFCVQYNESDYGFVSRLMEEEGIYFYFDHSGEIDKMVIRDDYTTPEDCPNKSDIPMYDIDLGTGEGWKGSIESFSIDYNLKSGNHLFWDYNFQLPGKKLDATIKSRNDIGGNQGIEVFSYPAGYAKRYDGIDPSGSEKTADLDTIFSDNKKVAENSMLATDSGHKVLRGISDCASITAGYRFNLKNHPNREMNISYIVVSVEHTCDQSPTIEEDDVIADAYQNEFTCIPHGLGHPEYRPSITTPKPVMQGTQTAFVVGPAGDEIYTDKFGRVKVQFHWDRDGKNDANSACWVRVAKDFAGNKYGSMYIPRIGQEVIVDFIGGDPDRPIITGSVYNPEMMPHYELPKYKTLSYIKTRTSPDDGKGFNELRFEDKQGKEQVFIHSNKRMDTRVKGSFYETCGGNRQERIGVRSDNQPGGNLTVTVGGSHDVHVKADEFVGIDGKMNEAVAGDVVEDYKGKQATMVTGARELNAQSITLEAMQKISLKVGGSFVTIDLSGVTISGPMVKVNSGGAAMGTSPATIDDPLDAESADTGEPGYLDRPRRGGGRGRNRRTLRGQHAPPFQTRTLPNGDIQVGNGLVIRQSATDPTFQNRVLEDLTTMSNHPTGMNTLNSINNSGQSVAIQDQPTGGNSYSPSNVQGALPNGQTGNFGGGIGTVTGDGSGSGGTVNYNPDNASNNAIRPRDVGLHHELSHADHAANGNYDILNPDPATPNNPHQEETNTIDADNAYRTERGVHTRTDHTTL